MTTATLRGTRPLRPKQFDRYRLRLARGSNPGPPPRRQQHQRSNAAVRRRRPTTRTVQRCRSHNRNGPTLSFPPAGQQQQANQSEKAADHAPPNMVIRPDDPDERRQPIAKRRQKFNLISTLSALYHRAPWFRPARKALTLQNPPFIRPGMAAGAILPPLFFEQLQALLGPQR